MSFRSTAGVTMAVVLVLASGCASRPDSTADRTARAAEAATDKVEKGVGDAAIAPLADLNLVRTKIPPVLLTAKQAPYAMPADRACAALAKDVRALDDALGPDLDAPPSANNPGLLERGFDTAGNAAAGAVRSTTEDVIPFRSWVRRLTGAERHSREVAAAIAAGGVRRAFLKGLARGAGCDVSTLVNAAAVSGKTE